MADFSGFLWPTCSLKILDGTAIKRQLSQCTYVEALPLPPFGGCGSYEVRARVSQSIFQSIFPLYCIMKTMAKISDRSIVVLKIRLPIFRSYKTYWLCFSIPDVSTALPFDATTLM